MKTPEKAYFGKRPDVAHFRIFGSSVYCHATKDARKKLEPIAEFEIFVKGVELHVNEELLTPKVEEPQIDVEQPHEEDPGVETSTQAESSKEGRKRTKEVDKLLDDARVNVGAPTSQHRQRRSPKRYTGYMDFMGECVVTEPSSFKEAVQQLVWVDAMVEEYDSIVRNSV
eukprot:PITA_28381